MKNHILDHSLYFYSSNRKPAIAKYAAVKIIIDDSSNRTPLSLNTHIHSETEESSVINEKMEKTEETASRSALNPFLFQNSPSNFNTVTSTHFPTTKNTNSQISSIFSNGAKMQSKEFHFEKTKNSYIFNILKSRKKEKKQIRRKFNKIISRVHNMDCLLKKIKA